MRKRSKELASIEVGGKVLRGNASQFFVAGELCRRGWAAVVTLGNCPNTDVLCSNAEGTKFAHIQVKTCHPGSKTCSIGQKAEKDYGVHFFWVIAEIPRGDETGAPRYFVIPSAIMAAKVRGDHKAWLESPGKGGQKHNDNPVRTVSMPKQGSSATPGAAQPPVPPWIASYEGQWACIEKVLK